MAIDITTGFLTGACMPYVFISYSTATKLHRFFPWLGERLPNLLSEQSLPWLRRCVRVLLELRYSKPMQKTCHLGY